MTNLADSRHTVLRVGILVNSLTLPRWVAKIIFDIQASSFAQIVLIAKNSGSSVSPKRSFRERLKTYWSHSLFERYRNWDRKRHKGALDAFEQTDLSGVLKDIPTISVQPIQKGFVDRFSPDDVARIRDADLDVLFRFGFRIIRGEVLSCANYGVWSFHHGDNREYRGAPPGFWEMYEGNPVVGSILQILTESLDGGRVIYRSHSATDFRSLYLTLNPLYWKTAQFAIRRLRDLHRYGWEYLQSLEEFNETGGYQKAIYRTPAAHIMVRFLARLAMRKGLGFLRSRFFEERTEWFIAFRARQGAVTVLNDRSKFKAVIPPRGRFYADPFLIEYGGKTYVFVEDFDFRAGRAAISYGEFGDSHELTNPMTALKRDYHLSYPFVFEHGGRIYMLPETRERGTIELYCASHFPDQWRLVKILAKDVLAVDPTVFRYENKFWLFVNIAVPGASTHDELHLFYSDCPEGEWVPHPKNPIVSDVRRSRPAGALFFQDGKLIRPSQDCSLRYGYAMKMNHVHLLSETEYCERQIQSIGPEWFRGSVCTHTYNRTEHFEVLDGMRIQRVFRLS
jgi:hypothetical protein